MHRISARWRLALLSSVLTLSGEVLVPVSVHAQAGAALPPARTYHADRYGRETRVVKERWSENGRGEKNGVYLEYNEQGALIKRAHFVNNVLNGEMMSVEAGIPLVSEATVLTGNFVNGKPEGVIKLRTYSGGVPGKFIQMSYYRNGVETMRDSYVNGIRYERDTFQDGKKNGLAKVYGATVNEFATGNYENDKLAGTWSNAEALEDGVGYEAGEDDGNSTSYNRVRKYKIRYKKGSEVTFYNGAPVSAENMH